MEPEVLSWTTRQQPLHTLGKAPGSTSGQPVQPPRQQAAHRDDINHHNSPGGPAASTRRPEPEHGHLEVSKNQSCQEFITYLFQKQNFDA